MATEWIAVLMPLFLTVSITAIKSGHQVDPCDYPGVAAVLVPDVNLTICSGLVSLNSLLVPDVCGDGIKDILQYFPLLVVYGDGSKSMPIPMNTTGTSSDGIFELVLSSTLEVIPSCPHEPTIYRKGMELVSDSCEVVGFGSDEQSPKIYDGVLNGANITKSTGAACCKLIYNSLSVEEKGILISKDVPLNCETSTGSTCGVSDVGGLTYCWTKDGQHVVTGLTASTPCVDGGTFLVHDVTGNDPKFKFGIAS